MKTHSEAHSKAKSSGGLAAKATAIAILAFLPASAFCVDGAGDEQAAPRKTFQLSFEKGLKAEFALGDPSPLKAQNVKLVEGLSGKAALIPRNGLLIYSLEGNFPKESGTLVMWMKPDWTPAGENRWLDADWRGLFCTAKDGATPKFADGKGATLRAMQDAMLHFTWQSRKSGEMRAWCGDQLAFSEGFWRCYAFAWDSRKGLRFWLDGKELARSDATGGGFGDANEFFLGGAIWARGVKGFEGAIDEISIYDSFLTTGQVAALCAAKGSKALRPELLDYALLAGKESSFRVKLHNESQAQASGRLKLVLKGENGARIASFEREVSVPPDGESIERFSVVAPSQGQLALSVAQDAFPAFQFTLFAIAGEPVSAAMPPSKNGVDSELLLESIDCAAPPGRGVYGDDGQCEVERSKIGAWRVAKGGKRLSGFAYVSRPLKHPGRPHWLEIEYPDDAVRAFYVAVFPAKDGTFVSQGLDTIGVITGDKHPLTNAMRTKRLLFWPDSERLVIGCFAHIPRAGEKGPALSKIKIFEVQGELPRLEIPSFSGEPARSIGVWNEDPYMPAANWFNQRANYERADLDFWLIKWKRTVAYMHYSGQNLWGIQSLSYEGDRNTLPLSLPQTGGPTSERRAGPTWEP